MIPAPAFSSFPAQALPRREERPSPAPQAGRHGKDRSTRHRVDKPKTNQVAIAPSPVSTPDSVYRDVVADKTHFSSTYTINAPAYRRRNPAVVGLPPLFRVAHDKSVRGLQVGSQDTHANASRTRLPLEPPPAKIRRLAPCADFDQHASFVGFTTRSHPQTLLEPHESDDEFDAAFSDLPRSDAARQSRVTAMERQLRADPHDITAWLEYSVLHLPPTLGDPLDGPFDKASAEVSLAILDRAIAANTSEDLHLAYLRISHHIQTPLEIAGRWRSVLATFPLPNIKVWIAYLGWCETDGFGTFDEVEEVVKVYSRVINSVSDESTLLHLFLRAATFLRNTGYDERSFALFQALIEITFFKPPHLISSTATPDWWHHLLDDFGLFWDSETPRFGEIGAVGWKQGIRPSSPKPSSTVCSDDWYSQEISKPADPYAVVIFDDIRSLLIPIISPEARLQTAHALLHILGIAVVPPECDLPIDPFLVTGSVTWPQPDRVYPWIQPPTNSPLHDLSMRYWAFDIDTLFAKPAEWFSFANARPPDPDLAKRCITQLQPLIPDPRFGMILLSFDSTSKRAKAMLSQDQTNLNLWYAYAALEISRHRYDSARSVFANALAFAKTQRAEAGEDELDLLAGWVQMEADLGEEARAVDLLCLLAGYSEADFILRIAPGFVPPKPSATQRLRGGQYCNSHPRLAYFYQALVRGSPFPSTDEDHLQFICRQQWLNRSDKLVVTVDTAIDLFPNNTMFQALHLLLTERQSVRAAERVVEDRIARSIIHMIWGIGEMARLAGSSLWKRNGSGAARFRELLQRAIRSHQGRQSLAVWKIYIEFESKMESTSVKQLCYRAVAALGSCKELYLLPFSPELRDRFSSQELRDWLLFMAERGIRIRVPFEHLLEVEDAPQLPHDEELQDDELAFLQETQRLKPYE